MPIYRKLEPCPFCRQTQSAPVHDRLCFDGTDYEVDQDYEIRIHCTTCGAAGPKVRHDANDVVVLDGKEIRRVPADWGHPKRPEDPRRFKPLLKRDFDQEAGEYYEQLALWQAGQHKDQIELKGQDLNEYFASTNHKPEYARIEDYKFYHEWSGNPPGPRTCYMAHHIGQRECTHWQLYETVSEGTPAGPIFSSREELIEWMKSDGFADWAVEMVERSGSCNTAFSR